LWNYVVFNRDNRLVPQINPKDQDDFLVEFEKEKKSDAGLPGSNNHNQSSSEAEEIKFAQAEDFLIREEITSYESSDDEDNNINDSEVGLSGIKEVSSEPHIQTDSSIMSGDKGNSQSRQDNLSMSMREKKPRSRAKGLKIVIQGPPSVGTPMSDNELGSGLIEESDPILSIKNDEEMDQAYLGRFRKSLQNSESQSLEQSNRKQFAKSILKNSRNALADPEIPINRDGHNSEHQYEVISGFQANTSIDEECQYSSSDVPSTAQEPQQFSAIMLFFYRLFPYYLEIPASMDSHAAKNLFQLFKYDP
jgi:hypothetical protein